MPIQLAFLAKKGALSDAVCFGYLSGAICRDREISKACLQILSADRRQRFASVGTHVGKCLFQSKTGL